MFFSPHLIKNWHIEPTTRCTVSCPKCPRTISAPQIGDLDFDVFRESFDPYMGTIEHFNMCGNHGDPIYHPKLTNFMDHFNRHKTHYSIVTNGSTPSRKWDQIIQHSDEYTKIILSVDGLEDTNHIYRVGARFDQIQYGMQKVADAGINMVWKFIVFSHNQHQIGDAIDFAKRIGVKTFVIVKSTRWTGPDDPMRPDEHWVNQYEKVVENRAQIDRIEPLCMTGHGHFLTAQGVYYPCCWLDKRVDQYNESAHNIHHHTLDEIMNSPVLDGIKQSWDNDLSTMCARFCGKSPEIETTKKRINSGAFNIVLTIN